MTPKNRSPSINEKSGVCGIFSRKTQQPLIEQVKFTGHNNRFYKTFFFPNKEFFRFFVVKLGHWHQKPHGEGGRQKAKKVSPIILMTSCTFFSIWSRHTFIFFRGSISSTCLCSAFTSADSRSTKRC